MAGPEEWARAAARQSQFGARRFGVRESYDCAVGKDMTRGQPEWRLPPKKGPTPRKHVSLVPVAAGHGYCLPGSIPKFTAAAEANEQQHERKTPSANEGWLPTRATPAQAHTTRFRSFWSASRFPPRSTPALVPLCEDNLRMPSDIPLPPCGPSHARTITSKTRSHPCV